MDERVIGEAKRASGQAVRVTESEFKGKTYLGIRLWDSVNGEYRPTSKGLSVESGNAQDEDALVTACRALIAHVEAKRTPAIVAGPPKRRKAR